MSENRCSCHSQRHKQFGSSLYHMHSSSNMSSWRFAFLRSQTPLLVPYVSCIPPDRKLRGKHGERRSFYFSVKRGLGQVGAPRVRWGGRRLQREHEDRSVVDAAERVAAVFRRVYMPLVVDNVIFMHLGASSSTPSCKSLRSKTISSAVRLEVSSILVHYERSLFGAGSARSRRRRRLRRASSLRASGCARRRAEAALRDDKLQ